VVGTTAAGGVDDTTAGAADGGVDVPPTPTNLPLPISLSFSTSIATGEPTTAIPPSGTTISDI